MLFHLDANPFFSNCVSSIEKKIDQHFSYVQKFTDTFGGLALSKRLNFSGPVGAGFFDLKPVGNRRRLQALLIQYNKDKIIKYSMQYFEVVKDVYVPQRNS